MNRTTASASVRFPERQSAPGSAERNTPAIVAALEPVLQTLRSGSESGSGSAMRVLELASGTGTHVAALARAVEDVVVFQPTEADATLCARIDEETRAHRAHVRPARILDLTAHDDWVSIAPAEPSEASATPRAAAFDAVLAFNLLHISPFDVTRAIFAHLDPAATLALPGTEHVPFLHRTHGFIAFYGAFKDHDDEVMSEGNAKFDADIRTRNPAFGVRSIDAVSEVAHQHGYALAERIAMPANNWILIYRPAARAEHV